MEKLLSSITLVVNAFDAANIPFQSGEDGDGDFEYHEIGSHEIVTVDDNRRQEWFAELKFDGKDPNVLSALKSALGEPTKVQPSGVLNWETKKLLIVFSDDSIEFIQGYTKS